MLAYYIIAVICIPIVAYVFSKLDKTLSSMHSTSDLMSIGLLTLVCALAWPAVVIACIVACVTWLIGRLVLLFQPKNRLR